MKRRSKTQFAVLGLLSWQEMSGYTIKKMIEMGLSHFWAESYGQLYPTLEKMMGDGLVTRTSESVGKRKRHIFHITKSGRDRFMEWLAEPTSQPQVRNEFQLKLFLASDLQLDYSLKLLREYQQQQQEQLAQFQQSDQILTAALEGNHEIEELNAILGKPSRQQLLFFTLSVRHGLRTVEARLNWCQDSIQILEKENMKKEVNR